MGVVSFAVRSIYSEVAHLIYKKIVVIPMLTYAHLIYALACCIGHVVVGAIFRTVFLRFVVFVLVAGFILFPMCVLGNSQFVFVLFCAGHSFNTLHCFVVDTLPGC